MYIFIYCASLSSFCLKYFSLCHLGQHWPKWGEKTFWAKFDKDTQYAEFIFLNIITLLSGNGYEGV